MPLSTMETAAHIGLTHSHSLPSTHQDPNMLRRDVVTLPSSAPSRNPSPQRYIPSWSYPSVEPVVMRNSYSPPYAPQHSNPYGHNYLSHHHHQRESYTPIGRSTPSRYGRPPQEEVSPDLLASSPVSGLYDRYMPSQPCNLRGYPHPRRNLTPSVIEVSPSPGLGTRNVPVDIHADSSYNSSGYLCRNRNHFSDEGTVSDFIPVTSPIPRISPVEVASRQPADNFNHPVMASVGRSWDENDIDQCRGAAPPHRRFVQERLINIEDSSQIDIDNTIDHKPNSLHTSKPLQTKHSSSHVHIETNHSPSKQELHSKKDSSLQDTDTPQCCICLEEPALKDLSRLNGCSHQFCFICIEKWAERENTCPLCKNRFSKIDRVNKLPPYKKRKKGDPPRGKSSKRIKNKDQRADMGNNHPFQGLLGLEGGGSMPISLQQLIQSGVHNVRVNDHIMSVTGGQGQGSNHRHTLLRGYQREMPLIAPLAVARRRLEMNSASTDYTHQGPSRVHTSQRMDHVFHRPIYSYQQTRDIYGESAATFFPRGFESSDSSNSLNSVDIQHRLVLDSFTANDNSNHNWNIAGFEGRNYASNLYDVDAGETADTALEIEDSDEEGEVIVLTD